MCFYFCTIPALQGEYLKKILDSDIFELKLLKMEKLIMLKKQKTKQTTKLGKNQGHVLLTFSHLSG